MRKWLFLLFFIGLALIGLGFTDFIVEGLKIYVLGGGFVLILLVFLSWWFSRRRKMDYTPVPGKWKPAPRGSREM